MAKLHRAALLFALFAAAPLAGCGEQAGLPEGMGNSVRANIAAQVDNPEPNLSTAPVGADGERLGDAYRRYSTGRVYPPIPSFETVREGQAAPMPAPLPAPGY